MYILVLFILLFFNSTHTAEQNNSLDTIFCSFFKEMAKLPDNAFISCHKNRNYLVRTTFSHLPSSITATTTIIPISKNLISKQKYNHLHQQQNSLDSLFNYIEKNRGSILNEFTDGNTKLHLLPLTSSFSLRNFIIKTLLFNRLNLYINSDQLLYGITTLTTEEYEGLHPKIGHKINEENMSDYCSDFITSNSKVNLYQ